MNSNAKARVSLGLAVFATLNLAVFVGVMAVDIGWFDEWGAWWLLLPTFAFWFGVVGAFLGTIGWIDVRRGEAERGLLPAQIGAILGGAAAGTIVLMLLAVLVAFLFFGFSLSGEGLD